MRQVVAPGSSLETQRPAFFLGGWSRGHHLPAGSRKADPRRKAGPQCVPDSLCKQRREPLSQPEMEGTLPKSTFSDASGRPTPRAGLSRESREAAGSTLPCTLSGEGHTGTGKGAVSGSFRWCGRWYFPDTARIRPHLTSHHMGLRGPH